MSVVGLMNKGGPDGITNLLMIDSPEICGGDRWFTVKEKLMEKNDFDNNNNKKMSSSFSSSSDSSIGDNSDVTGGEVKEDSGEMEEEEVQSSFKGPLDGMDALEDVLPMRRGISRFYNGKSKSFASLGEASSMSSIKHITKPDNPYNKRRRNLLASALIWDNNNNNHRSSPLSCVNGGGISKKKKKKKFACNSSNSATTLAFALSMNNNNNNNNNNHDDISSGVNNIGLSRFYSSSSSHGFKNFSGWRSFSFADLPQPGLKMDAAANPNPN